MDHDVPYQKGFIPYAFAALLIGLLWALHKNWMQNTFGRTSLRLIISGAIGNMIDRLFYGETFGNGLVVDFLDFCAFPDLWHWIFNVADAFVVVGAGIVFVYLIGEIIKEGKEEKRKKAQPQTEAPKDDHEG